MTYRLTNALKKLAWLSAPSAALVAAACGPTIEEDSPSLATRVMMQNLECKTPSTPLAQVVGSATLAVNAEGTIAVATDAERSLIFIVDLAAKTRVAISVDSDSRVGKALIHGDFAYVVAEGSGSVLKLDLSRGELIDEQRVCGSPRGMGLSNAGSLLHVACANGQLMTFDVASFSVTRSIYLKPDLRDVVALGDELVVSCFRSGELIVVDQQGEVVGTSRPLDQPQAAANTAWRMVESGGALYVLHQFSTTNRLGDDGTSGNFENTPPAYYGDSSSVGGGCGTQIVTPAITRFVRGSTKVLQDDEQGPRPPAGYTDETGKPLPLWGMATVSLVGLVGAVDFAVDKTGIATVIAPGNAWGAVERRARVSLFVPAQGDSVDTQSCAEPLPEEAPVAVALTADGRVVTQSREPALVGFAGEKPVRVSQVSRNDTGHRLFHMRAEAPIACVSCHPGGDHDGHVWNFSQFGKRRTQSLFGGVSQRVRYHWDGSLGSFEEFMNEVMGQRMRMGSIPEEAGTCLASWLDHLPDGNTGITDDEAAIARGKTLFESEEVECGSCHNGSMYSDRKVHDVGTGGEFVTPGLIGISTRAPFMHDGCSSTLAGRFNACGGGDKHGKTSHLSDDERDDLEAYLSSL